MSITTPEFLVHYLLENKYKRCYNLKTNEYTTVENIYNISQFYLPKTKHYAATDEGLKQYAIQLLRDADELESDERFKTPYGETFNYVRSKTFVDGFTMHRSHGSNIEIVFKLFAKYKELNNKYELQTITAVESSWMAQCPNGGLYYSIPKQQNVQSYGYDCCNFYGSNMSCKEFKFPTKPGKEQTVTDVRYKDKQGRLNIKFGYYRVKITSDDMNIKKLFSFSKYDVYTSESIKYAFELKEKHNYNINIDIVLDDKPNAYIYTASSLVSGDIFFKKWFDNILILKKRYPKNVILKMLSSSLWGSLSKRNLVYKTEKQVQDEKLNIGGSVTCDYKILEFNENLDNIGNDGKYILIDNKNQYKYPLRLKSFLTSYCRIKIANIVLQTGVDNVLRIATDGVVYSKPLETKICNFIAEQKTTGLLNYPIKHSKKKYNLND